MTDLELVTEVLKYVNYLDYYTFDQADLLYVDIRKNNYILKPSERQFLHAELDKAKREAAED